MSLDALGNIGEFVGSIGVLVSLLYLAIQIKKNTEAERVSAYRAIVSDFGHMNETLASNQGLTQTYVQGMEDFDALASGEKAQVSQVFYMTFRYFENMYYQHRRGYVEDELWKGWERIMLTYFARPGFQSWWRARRDVFSESFASFLENTPLDRPVASYAEITGLSPHANADAEV